MKTFRTLLGRLKLGASSRPYTIQWRHKEGSHWYDGKWHDDYRGEFSSREEAERNMDWLRNYCPNLWRTFDYRVHQEKGD